MRKSHDKHMLVLTDLLLWANPKYAIVPQAVGRLNGLVLREHTLPPIKLWTSTSCWVLSHT